MSMVVMVVQIISFVVSACIVVIVSPRGNDHCHHPHGIYQIDLCHQCHDASLNDDLYLRGPSDDETDLHHLIICVNLWPSDEGVSCYAACHCQHGDLDYRSWFF
jgi:hypothetical protein